MDVDWPFGELTPGKYGTIYADPPWSFKTWTEEAALASRGRATPYSTMSMEDIGALPVADLAAEDCCLLMWFVWPTLPEALKIIEQWGFTYKTCGFSWMKADASQLDMFRDDLDADMGLGYWSRSNNESCLLATRGNPKRLNADVRQGIIEPRREHSRKPDCVYSRIERLVAGPYVELFSRTNRTGWDSWGRDVGKFQGRFEGEVVNGQTGR